MRIVGAHSTGKTPFRLFADETADLVADFITCIQCTYQMKLNHNEKFPQL